MIVIIVIKIIIIWFRTLSPCHALQNVDTNSESPIHVSTLHKIKLSSLTATGLCLPVHYCYWEEADLPVLARISNISYLLCDVWVTDVKWWWWLWDIETESTRHKMEQAMRIRIWEEWDIKARLGHHLGNVRRVFISCKLFSPADGHHWQLCLHGWILVKKLLKSYFPLYLFLVIFLANKCNILILDFW